MNENDSLQPEVRSAIEAAQNKKAANIIVLDLSGLGAFTTYFLVCTAFSTPQASAIGDEIEHQLSKLGLKIAHREGRGNSEWVLLDYGNLIVHVFTERARLYYDLERLWRSARRISIPDLEAPSMPASFDQGAAEA
ncbi:MAG TPA: ribosome silencing factor [Candidatus Acidoferrales bacterium]|nr:ribosome silencing factor [Candidatus Acidoferrales bacterium]